MRVMALIDEIKIAIEKNGPQVGIVSRIVAGINHRCRIITSLQSGGDPIIKNTQRRQEKEYKIKTSSQNE